MLPSFESTQIRTWLTFDILQACITANRIYVQAGVYDRFASLLVERVKKLKVGHGLDPSSTMGPVTTPQSLDRVNGQVTDAVKNGAKLLTGGKRVEGNPGYFYEPTVLGDMTDKMLISREETFGPLGALYRFDTEEEVVQRANNTSVSFPRGSLLGFQRLNPELRALDGPG
jgi:succinate-semialdehyde dehydrogenase/glutarate-semialdehyde dehydrogenase